MYYYFEDKADLYATVWERAIKRVLELLGGFSPDDLTAENFWPTFERLTRRSVEYMERHEWYVKLARSYYGVRGRGGGKDPTAKLHRWAMRMSTDILRRGQELGVLRRDLPLGFLVGLTLAVGEASDRWLLDRWDVMSEEERERMVGAQLDVFRRLLERRA